MIPAPAALRAILEAAPPYFRNYGDVVITNVPAPINALKILLDMGLPIHKKIVVMEFDSPYNTFNGGTYGKERFVSSYQYLEEGTENDRNQNNVATYNPAMGTLTIHYNNSKNTIGRGHSKELAKQWLDASYCFA